MPDDILSPYLSETDRTTCLRTLTVLRSLVTDEHRQLVFFVGAGISANTGMPLVPELLGTLLIDAFKRSVPDKADSETFQKIITQASHMLGFEITLNSLWNSCPEAIRQHAGLPKTESYSPPIMIASLNELHQMESTNHWFDTRKPLVQLALSTGGKISFRGSVCSRSMAPLRHQRVVWEPLNRWAQKLLAIVLNS